MHADYLFAKFAYVQCMQFLVTDFESIMNIRGKKSKFHISIFSHMSYILYKNNSLTGIT